MGVLIDGVWTDGELPQETGTAAVSSARKVDSATASLPTVPPASRLSPDGIIFMSRTVARGPTAP